MDRFFGNICLQGLGMDFHIGFTDKEITPWGGMALMRRMMDRFDIDGVISSLGLPVPGSNRGYKADVGGGVKMP